MRRLSEEGKIDVALVGQSIAASNVTGRYYSLAGFRRILFALIAGAIAATKTVVLQIMEATDAAGTGAQAITTAIATITANTLVTKATVALASAANTDTVTINGVTFTMAAATSVADREFADATGLALCIASATYGVAGITGTVSTTNVILTSTEPGAYVITVSRVDVAGTVTLSTQEAIAFVDLDVSQLSLSDDYTHVAAKATTTGTTICAVDAVRTIARMSPTQKVGASAVV